MKSTASLMYTSELVRIHERRTTLLSRLGVLNGSDVGGNVGSGEGVGWWMGEFVGETVDGVTEGTIVGGPLFVGR